MDGPQPAPSQAGADPTYRYSDGQSLHPDTLLSRQYYPFIHTQLPHQLNHLMGHHFKRFIQINKGHPQDWSYFFARYFSCSWRNIKIASVKRPHCHKSERHVVNFTFLLLLLSVILHKSFLACYNITPYPDMSHKPTHPLYPCRHAPTNSCFDISVNVNRSHIWEKIQYQSLQLLNTPKCSKYLF